MSAKPPSNPCAQLHGLQRSSRVPGIAVGVGSRGISNIDIMAKAVVDFWIERGCQPFIIPVMGSHGGASAEGQENVLAHYGISEATMGVPVVSSLDVVQIGETPEGISVSMDRQAHEADGVMLLSRVKWHTSFEGKIESGVYKMMAIGLGKWEGAKRYHSFALRLGLEQVIRSVGKVVLDTDRMLGGLAILEDAHHNTAEVHALGAKGMLAEEEVLLERTKSWKAGLPFSEIDLLIIDEMGKNISGTGSDTKVMNRGLLGRNTLPEWSRSSASSPVTSLPRAAATPPASDSATSSPIDSITRSIFRRPGSTRLLRRFCSARCARRTSGTTKPVSRRSS